MRHCLSAMAMVLIATMPSGGFAQTAAPRAPVPPPGAERLATRTPPFISPIGRVYRATPEAPDPVAAWFAFVDRNHDGKIDLGELRAEAVVLFRELDVNHDGEIDPDEIRRYETEIAPETQLGGGEFGEPRGGGRGRGGGRRGGGGGGGRGQGGGRPPGGNGPEDGGGAEGGGDASGGPDRTLETARGAGVYSFINIPEPVASADADSNRGVTLSELEAASDRRFRILDPTNTGRLIRATLPQTPAQRRGNPILKHRR